MQTNQFITLLFHFYTPHSTCIPEIFKIGMYYIFHPNFILIIVMRTYISHDVELQLYIFNYNHVQEHSKTKTGSIIVK